MRIQLFLGRLATGGAEGQFVHLLEGLLERGHPACLTAIHPGGQLWESHRRRLPIESLWARRSGTSLGRAWQYATAWRRLRASVREFHPDVVYSALYPPNFIAWLALRPVEAPPLVWGIEASDLPPRWPRELFFRLGALASRSVPLAISNSRAGVDHHRERGYRPGAWTVIPNGVDTTKFRPDPDAGRQVREEWGIQDRHHLVGAVGRLVPAKGYPDFIRAAARVGRERSDARFVIVGGGPDAYRRRLLDLAATEGISDRLQWAGVRDDMPAVYNALDLHVLSSHTEGLPNVVGEAMACGTPCVVTDVGDVAELVGDAGTVVPAGRPALLARAISSRLEALGASGDSTRRSDPETSRHLRERAVSLLSEKAFVEETAARLAEVAAGSLSARRRTTS